LSGTVDESNTASTLIDFVVGTEPSATKPCDFSVSSVSQTLVLKAWLAELKQIRNTGAPLALTSLDFGLVFGVKTVHTANGSFAITPVTVSANTQRERDDLHTLKIFLDPPPPQSPAKTKAKREIEDAKASAVTPSVAPIAGAVVEPLPPPAVRLQLLERRMFLAK
jgi:hypothetical protein